MQVTLTDRATVAGVRKTRDGYLVAEARIARTGIQNYTAGELGIKDRKPTDIIRVYRPADEVFSADAMASLAHRPITIDHPREPVTADNWKRHSVGTTGGEVMRDGEFVKVPLVLMDKAAITAVDAGKRELSVGYSCNLEMTAGISDSGEAYDAVQRGISGNHLAICDVARGGPQLRIGDQSDQNNNADAIKWLKKAIARHERHMSGKEATSEASQQKMMDEMQAALDELEQTQDKGMRKNMKMKMKDNDMMIKTITFDGLPVDVTDAAEAVIQKLQGQVAALDARVKDAETKVGTLTADADAKAGRIAALETELADASDPAKLSAKVAARAALVGDAKKLAPALTIADSMGDAEIRRAVVEARLGDKAKDMSDAAIDGAFAALAPATGGTDQLKDGIRDAANTPVIGDAKAKWEAARAEREKQLRDGWKSQAA